MTVETRNATSLVSGAVSGSSNALGAPNGVYTTDSGNVSWTARFAMANPVGNQANGTHTITVRVRKQPGQSGTPQITSIHLYEGGSLIASNIQGGSVNVTSTTGQDVAPTFNSSILTGLDLDAIEVEIVTTGAGGSPSARAAVQLDAITWSGDFTTVVGGTPATVSPGAAVFDVATPVPAVAAVNPPHAPSNFPDRTIIWGGTPGHPWQTTGGAGSTFDLEDESQVAPHLAGASCSVHITTDGSNANTFVRDLGGTAMDFTDRVPQIWFRVDHKDRIADLNLWLGSGGGLADAYVWSFDDLDLTVTYYNDNEWVVATLPWSMATVNGSPNRAALTDLNFQIFDGGIGPLQVWWGGLASIPDTTARWPNGVVSFTFDDGFASHKTIAAPYLAGKGWRGTSFIINDVIDTSPYMSTAQLVDLHDTDGWEIGLHSETAADHNAAGGFTSLTTSQREANVAANRSFLTGLGLPDPVSFAYPQGFFDQATADDLGSLVNNARTTKGDHLETAPAGDRVKIYTRALDASTAVATITGLIDDAAANGEWLVLLVHDIVASGATGVEINQADFEAIVDYAETAAVDVLPLGEVQAIATTVPVPATVSPPAAVFDVATAIPTVTGGVGGTPATVSPPTAVIDVATPVPTVSAGTKIPATVSPPAALFDVATPSPELAAAVTITPQAATVELVTPTPTVVAGSSVPATVSPPAAVIDILTPVPAVAAGSSGTPATVSPPAAIVDVSTPVPTVAAGTKIPATVSPPAAVFTVTPQTPQLAAAARVEVSAALIDLATPTPTVFAGETPLLVDIRADSLAPMTRGPDALAPTFAAVDGLAPVIVAQADALGPESPAPDANPPATIRPAADPEVVRPAADPETADHAQQPVIQ